MTEFLTAPHPIRTVLIANRGEIACRVIATCRRLGLRTVAVCSEADKDALHTRLADESRLIGPASASMSYLSIPAVIAAARDSGADAIHPGYGFLSENAAFARACEEAGIVFIGPSAEAVQAMGSKIEARRIAEAAGVPVVPGYTSSTGSMEDLAQAAKRIGYPVMVKASAGGGGRGMRRVLRPEDLQTAIESARAEAGSAFGDDTVFIEKLIEAPRHLEVQVFGDGRGGALHFFERDCSVQRNHQKVIEEAPAPNLPVHTRTALIENATKLARAIGYAGAGTVEFIMASGSDSPYFLEMNTRLQVEHPVTEAICGVDLVELQLRQAAGLPLGLSQDQIVARGHAIEVRLNAERPDQGFLPATGRFEDICPPPGLRFDTGVSRGSEVGSNYDSMVAKLIAWAPDRDGARRRLIDGLKQLYMPGVALNQAFLSDCLAMEEFAEGRATTDFLGNAFPEGWQPDSGRLRALRAQAALAALETEDGNPLRRSDAFRVTRPRHNGVIPLAITDDYGEVELLLRPGSPAAVREGDAWHDVDGPTPQLWHTSDGKHFASGGGLTIAFDMRPLSEARLGAAGRGASTGSLTAPLGGIITRVHVTTGQQISAGDALVEMEAMKLIHTIRAPFDGTVTRVACAEGDVLGARALLIDLEANA